MRLRPSDPNSAAKERYFQFPYTGPNTHLTDYLITGEGRLSTQCIHYVVVLI